MSRLTSVAHILPVIIDGNLLQQQKALTSQKAGFGEVGEDALLERRVLKHPRESTLWSGTPSNGSYLVLNGA